MARKDFGSTASPRCLAESPSNVSKRRTHEGLPVMSAQEFDSLLATKSTEKEMRIFDFRGFLEDEHGKLFYADALSANFPNGIHVWVMGDESWGMMTGRGLHKSSPETIDHYVLFVNVPQKAQEEQGVVVANGQCARADEFSASEKELVEMRKKEEPLTFPLQMRPLEDTEARERLRLFVLAVGEYLRRGMPLERIEDFIYNVEDFVHFGPIGKSSCPQVVDEIVSLIQ